MDTHHLFTITARAAITALSRAATSNLPHLTRRGWRRRSG
uniref:Uncharacterized protein n=1 Tax=Arundo donax TaxID=35708 RepID=A0A0A8Z508_ARUDO